MPGLNAFDEVGSHDFTDDPATEEAFDLGVERRVAEDVADDDATPEAPGPRVASAKARFTSAVAARVCWSKRRLSRPPPQSSL
ncbi:MAG: hypothetical protein RL309_881, partial [Verrucomicrobiota bacterium]